MSSELLQKIKKHSDKIEQANKIVIQRMVEANPVLVDFRPARDVIPGMTDRTIHYSGPPVDWDRQSGPQKGAIIGAILFEGLAKTPQAAVELVENGGVELVPNHHRNTVGSMAGAISASIPVWVVKNEKHGNFGYSTFESDLSFGNYSEETLKELRWQKDVLQPVLGPAIADWGGIELNPITAKGLQMGDDCHQRFEASTYIINNEFTKALLASEADKDTIQEVLGWLDKDRLLYLSISMAASKATADAAHNVVHSSICSAVARNGTETGIRVSGLGDRWFTAPAPLIIEEGIYFTGYSHLDASNDIGDSAINETVGLGGAAVYAAPTHWAFFGEDCQSRALEAQNKMWSVCAAKHPNFVIPALDFQGSALGLDIIKVVQTGYEPIISTAISSKDPKVGRMVGAGLSRIPMEAFKKALKALVEKLEADDA